MELDYIASHFLFSLSPDAEHQLTSPASDCLALGFYLYSLARSLIFLVCINVEKAKY